MFSLQKSRILVLGLFVCTFVLGFGDQPTLAAGGPQISVDDMVQSTLTFTDKMLQSYKNPERQIELSQSEMQLIGALQPWVKVLQGRGLVPLAQKEPGYWSGRGVAKLGMQLASVPSDTERNQLLGAVIAYARKQVDGLSLSDTDALAVGIILIGVDGAPQ